MPYTRYYVPPEQIINGTFTIQCKDTEFTLDKDLEFLETLKFTELLQISQKLGVFARRRGTKSLMISEIKRIIIFALDD